MRYEIWNEPNLRGGWCPNPQPERYADMFMIAAHAIRSADPHAQVMIGGTAPPAKQNKHNLGIAEFLARATARRPGMVGAASGAAADAEGWRDWEVTLKPGVTAGELLDACFEKGLRLHRFDEHKASLHDVFLHLAGDEAQRSAA